MYLAYRDPLDTGRWPAAEKLESLNGLAVNLQKALDELAKMPQTTDQEKAAYAAQLQLVERKRADISNNVEDVDMMRELYALFGRSPI